MQQILGKLPDQDSLCDDDKTIHGIIVAGGMAEYAEWTSNNKDVPEYVWNQRMLLFRFPPCASRFWLAQELAKGGRLNRLLERVIAGHSEHEENGTVVGYLTDDSQFACVFLQHALDYARIYN